MKRTVVGFDSRPVRGLGKRSNIAEDIEFCNRGTPLASVLRNSISKLSYFTTSELTLKSILDPSFRYTNSVDTDLRKTFARVRREQRKLQQAVLATNVQPIRGNPPLRLKGAR